MTATPDAVASDHPATLLVEVYPAPAAGIDALVRHPTPIHRLLVTDATPQTLGTLLLALLHEPGAQCYITISVRPSADLPT